ncbi:hypothetical protein ACK31H_02950 [Aeromonas caviae]|uniref:hypothetical protein n=1 Tax=Aeromonas caviae TaxID=648 RepID=UPI0023DB1350|nr:hypothetical protein [Aeromonas caviae]MDF2277543.1 hypothetical protein [Aeromonas caviae]
MDYKLEFLCNDYDNVIKSHLVTARSNYRFALDKLIPAIERLDFQRDRQRTKFYERLAQDIQKGCIMPPLTLAVVTSDTSEDNFDSQALVMKNLDHLYVLDGIQRLYTLKNVESENTDAFPYEGKIYFNILICESFDMLLYRMITLNNGQKPMTARHQIEIVAGNVFDFENHSIPVSTENKRGRIKGGFKKADLIKAYLAFLSNSANIENNKIIEEKMDEIIAKRIIDSDLPDEPHNFTQVLELIDRLSEDEEIFEWLKVSNNLIGFCAGYRSSADFLISQSCDDFKELISLCEKSLKYINVSKIKTGEARRNCVQYYFNHIEKLSLSDEYDVAEKFASKAL